MSASSPSGAAAVSAAGISGFSPVGTVCACADATPKPAASITSIARLYRVLEIMTPPAYFRREDACTSARNCGGGGSRHFVGGKGGRKPNCFLRRGLLPAGYLRGRISRSPRASKEEDVTHGRGSLTL